MSLAYLATPPPKDEEVRIQPKLRSTRLLVVEDDPQLIPLLSRALVHLDPDIVLDWAMDADEARSAMMCEEYDAVLADFMLPNTDTGFAIREECRVLQPEARFAMMSALPVSQPSDSVGFLSKPFSPAECREFLERLLERLD